MSSFNRTMRRNLAHAIPGVSPEAALNAETIGSSAQEMKAQFAKYAKRFDVPLDGMAYGIMQAYEAGCCRCGTHDDVTLVVNRIAHRTVVYAIICGRCLVLHGQPHSKGGDA